MSDPILGRIAFGPPGDTRTPSASVDTTTWDVPLHRTITANAARCHEPMTVRLVMTAHGPDKNVGAPVSRVKRWFDPLSGAEVHDEALDA